MEENKRPSSKQRMLVLAGGIALVVLIFAISLIYSGTTKEKEANIITTTTLQKIVNESELSTSTSIYNGIAEVYNEKKTDKVDCYVAYHARVSAGIDFAKVKIKVDNERKTITITIPQVHITSTDVDVESMDFIFYNAKANTSTFTAKALKACEDDVKAESEKQTAITDLAKQNAINAITAWVEPFIKDIDNTYTLVVQ